MLLKWIKCAVRPGCENDFSVVQEQWSRLAIASGFCGQFGGWNSKRHGEACILGIWRDESAYQQFMSTVHDSITKDNHQASTYDSSSVVLAEVLLEMDHEAADSTAAITHSGLLRVADCSVHSDRIHHFMSVQQEVWSPGMKAAGMLHGWFSRVADTERFLVLSLWPNAATHQAYMNGPFTELRKRAAAELDLASIDGGLVNIERRWTVTPRPVKE